MLDSIMEFVKVGNGGKFHTAIFHKLLRAIVSFIACSSFLTYDCFLTLLFLVSSLLNCIFSFFSLLIVLSFHF